MSTFKINLNKGLIVGGSFKVRKSEDNGNTTSTPTTAGSFNYVYNLLDLEYIQNIGHHIYNSNYDIN